MMWRKKLTWKTLRNYMREVLALLMLLIAIFFFRSERKELASLASQLHAADPIWIAVCFLLTLLYIYSQGQMYVSAFRALDIPYSVVHASELFLRRNLLSVFLPAGGVSSLAYAPPHIRKLGIKPGQLHTASAIYTIAGFASVVVVGLPILLAAIWKGNNVTEAWPGLMLVVLICSAGIIVIDQLRQKKSLYRFLNTRYPSITGQIDQWLELPLDKRYMLIVLSWSMIVEACGILTLYVALRALGAPYSLEASAMAYTLSVLIMIASPFLRGLGAVELSIVAILGWYGIKNNTAFSATVLYRIFEFWIPLGLGVLVFMWKGRRLFARIFPALMIFALGMVNIISAVTPPIAKRVKLLHNYIPFEGIHASTLLVFLTGLLLLTTSAFLLNGMRSAWWLAILLSAVSLLGHLSKALDWEESLFATCTIFFLLLERKQYRISNNRKLVRVGLAVAALVFASILVFGTVSLYYNEVKNFGINFGFRASLLHATRILFLLDDSGLHPLTRFAHEFIWLLRALASMAWMFLFYCIIRPFVSIPEKPGGTDEARQIIEVYGNSAIDHFKTGADKLLFFSTITHAFVAYRIANNYAVALEEPVCSEEDKTEVMAEFDDFCKRTGLIPIYYRIDEDGLNHFQRLRKHKLLIGQEALLDLEKFSLQGTEKKSLRNAMNSLGKKGFNVFILEPPHTDLLMDELQVVSDEWLREYERNEMTFSQGMFNRKELMGQQLLVVKNQDGCIVAFLNIIPDYAPGECTFDLIRKTSDAPGGCMDLLIITLIAYARGKGFQYLNLGMVPMAGIEHPENAAEQLIRYGYDHMKRFRQYKGLRNFKEKYADIWLNKYLVYENDFDLLRLPNVLTKIMQP